MLGRSTVLLSGSNTKYLAAVRRTLLWLGEVENSLEHPSKCSHRGGRAVRSFWRDILCAFLMIFVLIPLVVSDPSLSSDFRLIWEAQLVLVGKAFCPNSTLPTFACTLFGGLTTQRHLRWYAHWPRACCPLFRGRREQNLQLFRQTGLTSRTSVHNSCKTILCTYVAS